MKEKRAHIIKRDTRWGLLKEGKSRASRVYNEKEDAIKAGTKLLEQGYDLIIHNKDGTVQTWERTSKRQTYRTIKTPHGVAVTRRPINKLIHEAAKQ